MIEAYVSALTGTILLISRLFPRAEQSSRGHAASSRAAKVSIIIPARNEERNLPKLLNSLEQLEVPAYEVIVVDDHSEDMTAAVAQSFPFVRVLSGAPCPADWTGKNWACHQGAQVASGEILLFTDADTCHRPDSLKRAVAALEHCQAGLLSCLPYHLAHSWWEKLLGPFHMILLAMTAPYAKPAPRRVFAIGQYLLFKADAYRTIGGHAAIKQELVDDLALARVVIQKGLGHHVYRGPALFDVRMYDTLGDFLAGWRRNFRLGFHYAHPLSGLEATLMIMAFTGAGHLFSSWFTTALSGICLLFMLVRQKSLGRFSWLGVGFLPFALTLFCLAAGLALFDLVSSRQLHWKGRGYSVRNQTAQTVDHGRYHSS